MVRDDVSPLDAGDGATAAAVAALLNRELGDGLYRPEWLLEDAASPTAGVWVTGAPDVAGAAVARLLGRADSDYYEAFGAAGLDLFDGSAPVGSLEAVAVEAGARGHGAGSRLVTTSLEWMRGRGCSAAVTVSWQSGREGSSAGLFRRLGMREGPTVERFYHEESVRNGWACPVCGGPCSCAATLFTLAFTR